MKNKKSSLIIVLILTSLMAFFLVILIALLDIYILLIANLVPAVVSSAYIIISYRRHGRKKLLEGINRSGLPFLFFGLIIIPVSLTGLISLVYSFDVYLLAVAFAMPLTFLNILFYIPLAIYDTYLKKSISTIAVMPSLTVIVPAFNEETHIKRTLGSIIGSDYPNKEVIVVDDGSTDQTYNMASRYIEELHDKRFSIIRKKNGGKASAINLALRFARGEIIIIIDADSRIEKNTLKETAKEFLRPEVIAVAGKVRVLNKSNFLTKCTALEVAIGINLLRAPFSLFGTIMIIPGSLGAFRKKDLLKRGLYDKDTLTEDFDITLKLLKTGGTIRGIHSASYTEVPESLSALYRQRIRWYRGNLQTLIKHKDAMLYTNYDMLQKFSYPITFLTFFVPPFLDIIATAFAILSIIGGSWILLIIPLIILILLQFLLSTIAIILEGEKQWKLIWYSPFALIGYKQILSFIIIKSIFDVLLRKNLKWTYTRQL
jgi:cellulose synthase/poly-beta-1,6-N-acetylglucosamine synthase-like glycosyltransferase